MSVGHPAIWAERIVDKDDALTVAAWIFDAVYDVPGLGELDTVMMILEARADDPGPYTIVRAAIALRLKELE